MFPAALMSLVIGIIVLGFLFWLLDAVGVVSEPFLKIAKGILIFCMLLFILNCLFGWWTAPLWHFGTTVR